MTLGKTQKPGWEEHKLERYASVSGWLEAESICSMNGGTNKAVVAVDKLDTKKRGPAKVVVAAYCPFCGHKLRTSSNGSD